MSTDMSEDIRDGSQYNLIINIREKRYNICDRIKRGQAEWKGYLLSMRNMGKVLHKVFKAFVNEILQVLSILYEYGSEVSYFIIETRRFAEVTILSEYIKKPFLKANLKEINNLIKNQNVLVQDTEKGEHVTPFMDVYKAKI